MVMKSCLLKSVFILILAAACLSAVYAADNEQVRDRRFGGNRSTWNGFGRYDFQCDSRKCIVVVPGAAAQGLPWIWRARFFGHQPQTDIALLERGFHLVYMDVAGLYGSPRAVAHWNVFYKYLTKEHGFAKKPALEGMSRGGFIIYNWAAQNPDKVACIYGDAPVCDFKSWPGGKGAGKGSPADWQRCIKAYNLSEDRALNFKHNPIDNLKPLAEHNVGLLNICGAADKVVPIDENTNILRERYKALGGNITVMAKPGIGHHPHSFKDPTLIANFILKHTTGNVEYFTLRNKLQNSRIKFQQGKTARVVFMGGSITNMNGWRIMVGESLQKRYPDTEFDFINAGIPSTDSTLGAFRLADTVFCKGPVDLLFVEYAVNDFHNNRNATARTRGMEGVIRGALNRNPDLDIIMMHFIDPQYMPMINTGTIPPVIASHEKVADHYTITSLNLAQEVTERINFGEFTWKDDFRNLHPSPFRHRLYNASIDRLLDAAWKKPSPTNTQVIPHKIPAKPIDPLSYYKGRYIDIKQADIINGWKIDPAWTTNQGGTRPRFRDIPMLTTESPEATIKLDFTGTAIGILVVAGFDAGILEYSIDNAPAKSIDQFTQWSGGLHIPWAYMLESELKPGNHTLTLRTTNKKNDQSKGFACRIVKFLAN